MARTFKENVSCEKRSFMIEAIIIASVLLALFLALTGYGLKKQDEVLEGMGDLSENLVQLSGNFAGAYQVLEARQEEARMSTAAVRSALDSLSLSLGEINVALNQLNEQTKRQKQVSDNLARTAKRQQRVAPKRATETDIKRFKEAIQ